MLNIKFICITCGTAIFVRTFEKTIIEQFRKVKHLFVFSHEECNKYEMDHSVLSGFDYSSSGNSDFLAADELSHLIAEHFIYPKLNIL